MAIKTRYLLIAVCSILSVCSCRPQQQDAAKMPPNTFTVNGSVREMNIWPENTTFPEHAGKAEFVSYCGICHSLKYISSQPDFPCKTWDAEVHKMIAKYNAPIDSVTARKIVEYLVAIKSKP